MSNRPVGQRCQTAVMPCRNELRSAEAEPPATLGIARCEETRSPLTRPVNMFGALPGGLLTPARLPGSSPDLSIERRQCVPLRSYRIADLQRPATFDVGVGADQVDGAVEICCVEDRVAVERTRGGAVGHRARADGPRRAERRAGIHERLASGWVPRGGRGHGLLEAVVGL